MNTKAHILICDDDEAICYLLKEQLITVGYKVDIVYDGKFAIDTLKKNSYDLLLLDLRMRQVQGHEVLKFAREEYPSMQVIILTGESDIQNAIKCIKLGAYDFIAKPYDHENILISIERALEHRELAIRHALLEKRISPEGASKIIGESEVMKKIVSLAHKAARSDSNILIEGETGTGKELFAELIHKNSMRSAKPFVIINCAAMPDQLIESELFGYEKGAFTDARTTKQGLVEIANGGTLFLDEIGEMSLNMQPKLLRFLENGEYRRIGGVNSLSSNVRVIGATNKNLFEESEIKKFRKDLLFRLNVITLPIPPLRERGKDILLLAEHFIKIKSSVHSPKNLSERAKQTLMKYEFPGNVRELEHIIERALIFTEGEFIKVEDLFITHAAHTNKFDQNKLPEEAGELLSLEDLEKIQIKNVLDKFNWDRGRTALTLGITPKTLYLKIKKYNIQKIDVD